MRHALVRKVVVGEQILPRQADKAPLSLSLFARQMRVRAAYHPVVGEADVVHREVDVLPAPTLGVPGVQRGEDGLGRRHRRGLVHDQPVVQAVALGLRLGPALGGDHSRGGLHERVVGHLLGPGAGLAKAADGAVDQVGVDRGQRLVVQPQPAHDPRAHVPGGGGEGR